MSLAGTFSKKLTIYMFTWAFVAESSRMAFNMASMWLVRPMRCLGSAQYCLLLCGCAWAWENHLLLSSSPVAPK